MKIIEIILEDELMNTGMAEGASNNLQTVIKSFVNSPNGQKYKKYDCKTVTRAFVQWAEQNKIPAQVVSLAPPSAGFIAKNPRYKGKSGKGDGHIMPVVNDNAIDFTVRQFGVSRPFENPLVTPTGSLSAVYGKFGYFTDKPAWFLGGKSHWIGTLKSIPSEIFNQNFGDEILEQGVAEGFYDSNPATYDLPRRILNVPELIRRGAIFVTYPHDTPGWETDAQEDWQLGLISLYNVAKGPAWSVEAKKYLKPKSYKNAEHSINSSAPNLGSDKLVYDGKYNQILWSIKKLGIPDNVAFLDKDKKGVAEGMGSSSPTRVMRKYLPNDMWDSILSHSGKSKHDNADGSKTSYVWRLRNLTRSWQGREFNAWKQAVEQELGSDYQVTSKWPTPSVRHIQMNDISAQQGVTEASYPGNIGMMEVAKFFNMATPKEKIIFKRLMNMGEKNKAWQLIQKVTGVKLRGKEFDLVAEGLSIDVPNEQWLQDKIDYAKSKGRDQWGAPFFGTTTAYARPDPQVSVVRLELLKGMRNEQDNVRAKDLEWLMAHMEKTGKLPLTKRGEEYAPYVMVAYNGEAWVNDGNHRIMAAYRLGWKTLPVQLAYFDGGERVESGIMYPKKIGL